MKKIPTYEYYCESCKGYFFEQRSLSEETKYDKCPNDGKPMQRKYNVSVSFNGSGFYTTDKKRKNGE